MNSIICANKNYSPVLEKFVAKSSSLNLVGTFSDIVSVQQKLSKRHDIGLIFLDVDHPEVDIFSFINSFIFQTNIIIVSSEEKDALKAFEYGIVDYLLKPVTYSRFCKAVDKAIRYYANKEVSNSNANEIFIKKGSTLVKLKIKDIIYIEALENYVTLNTKNEKFTIHLTMKAIEYELPSDIFCRVHRSYIVNISSIRTIKEKFLEFILANGLKKIPIGSSYRDPLLDRINVMLR